MECMDSLPWNGQTGNESLYFVDSKNMRPSVRESGRLPPHNDQHYIQHLPPRLSFIISLPNHQWQFFSAKPFPAQVPTPQKH